jgi:predicted RNase H-like HicB family nuclease
MTYYAVFERADDGSVQAYVPDLPGCTSGGPTLAEARANIREALALWIAAARERGIPIPPPSTIGSVTIEVDAP